MPSRVFLFPCLTLALAVFVTLPVASLAQTPVAAPARVPSRLPAVASWGYVLQGHDERPLDVDALAASKAGLLVVEPSVGDRPMSAEEVTRLRGAAGRPVLAYLSIGEAESYRAYWRAEWSRKAGRPAFLGPENPDWKGNFKVRYWLPEWQAIIQARLAELVAAGFDGVYLDIIDAYEFWGPGGPKSERKTAAEDMVAFVLALGETARKTRPTFAVVPQNGAGLLDAVPAARAAAYLDAVDAIGAEDSFFYGDADEDNPWAPQKDTLAALDRFHEAGRPVLAVDYVTRPAAAKRFVEAARARGFVPYVGRRALDRLVVQP